METPQQTEGKRSSNRTFSIMAVIGFLITMFTCLFFVGAVMLDVAGTKAIGKLSNAAVGCPPGKSCWTGKMEFTANDGEKIAFYPMTFPMFFDFDPFLSGRSYEEYGNYQVRYFESFPQLAKVKLAFFLEYVNYTCALGLGGFLLLIGRLGNSSKPNKPIVIDLSGWRKK